MRLKQLRISGFKSFADTTVIEFPGAVAGIVGPNGCGKSNVIDAIRWVLGEARVSELRGSTSMSELIFSGSVNRPASSRASVELVLDNSDGTIKGAWGRYTELSVKRVVTRDGSNAYLINNQQVRRRDVQDIFMGTGLGPRSYAIISQGMISNFIKAKPEELRVYLEEAAGVSRLIEEFGYTHEQAAEAIGRSRSATTNLLRLLNLTEAVKQMLADGKIDMGHARALLALSGAEQIQLANEIVAKDLSVRETERLIARMTDKGNEKKAKDGKKEPSADDRILEERLAESIGAPVHVVYGKKGRGKIVIDFADLDDLDALIAKLAPEKM